MIGHYLIQQFENVAELNVYINMYVSSFLWDKLFTRLAC